MIYAGFEAGRMQGLKYKSCRAKIFSRGWSRYEISIQALKPVTKISYAKVSSSKLDQGNKYNIPHLKVSIEAFFSEIIRANKKVLIFQQGNCTMNVLHPSLSKSLLWVFASGGLWKTQPWDIFERVRTGKCIASCNHDGSLEDN